MCYIMIDSVYIIEMFSFTKSQVINKLILPSELGHLVS